MTKFPSPGGFGLKPLAFRKSSAYQSLQASPIEPAC